MASGYTSMSSMERETCKITVNGKSYTMAEYKKMLKETIKMMKVEMKKAKMKVMTAKRNSFDITELIKYTNFKTN